MNKNCLNKKRSKDSRRKKVVHNKMAFESSKMNRQSTCYWKRVWLVFLLLFHAHILMRYKCGNVWRVDSTKKSHIHCSWSCAGGDWSTNGSGVRIVVFPHIAFIVKPDKPGICSFDLTHQYILHIIRFTHVQIMGFVLFLKIFKSFVHLL